ncbi:hypothetical protein HDU86_007163 [Geranomyces michiganensis]|nr:hypothetical protein HDU86_007163 [Geranomyces michiganensis]
MTDIPTASPLPPVAQLSSLHLPHIAPNIPLVSQRQHEHQHPLLSAKRLLQQQHTHLRINHPPTAEGSAIAVSSTASAVGGGRQPLLRRSHSRVGLGLGLNLENAFVKRDVVVASSQENAVSSAAKMVNAPPDRILVSAAGQESAASAAEEATPQIQVGRNTRRRSGWEWLKGTKGSAPSVAEVEEERTLPEGMPSAANGGEEYDPAAAGEEAVPFAPALQPVPTQPILEEAKHELSPRRSITFNLQQPSSTSDGDEPGHVDKRAHTPLSVRRRRSGWWDGTANREMEILRVKKAVRQSGTLPVDGDKANEAEPPPAAAFEKPASLPDDGKTPDEPPDDPLAVIMPVPGSDQPASVIEPTHPDTKQTTESDRASRLRKRNSSAAMMSVLHMSNSAQDAEDHYSAESRSGVKHQSGEAESKPSPDVSVVKADLLVAPIPKDEATASEVSSERERALNLRLRKMQTQVQQLNALNAKQRDLIELLSNNCNEAAFPQPLPPELGAHLMARFCDAHRMDGALHGFISDTGPAGRSARRTVLWDRLVQKRFTEAVKMVEDVKRAELRPQNGTASAADMNTSRGAHFSAAFEDLAYVLTKYMCIHLVQISESTTAHKVLDGVLRPKVDRERAGSSRGRGEWFLRDLTLLADLVRGEGAADDNPYARLEWEQELDGFWTAARTWRRFHAARTAEAGSSSADAEHGGPLFARALGEFFCDDDFDSGPNAPSALTLETLSAARNGIDRALALLADFGNVRNNVTDVIGSPRRQKGRRRPGSAGRREQKQPVEDDTVEAALAPSAVAAPEPPSPSLDETPSQPRSGAKHRTKSQKPPWSSDLEPPEHAPATPPTAPTGTRKGASADLARRSSRTARSDDQHSGQTGYSFNSDSEMPPQPTSMLSSEFALSTICGPVLNEIRALDVTCIPETGQIVAATAGSHDRSDKRISLWDVRSGTLLAQLDNGTSKPVTCLAFHPDDPGLLLSADMEFDVKLWDWREPGGGRVVRLWRKHHTRIIFRAAFVPGADNQAATCSGDQSIKVFPLDGPNAGPGAPAAVSVHANEPFTSFVFVGNPDDKSQQKLVASLSYSIRIYRLRTATLLHTIQMTSLRASKTPITALSSHPVHDSYTLVSCDNQLQLFNLHTESTVKTYQSRSIPNGVRVEGQFSPCGGWLYCGTWDVKGRVKKKGDSTSGPTTAAVTSSELQHQHQQQQRDSQHAKRARCAGTSAGGVVIWKVHTGKSELLECGEDVSACRWVLARQKRRGGPETGYVERKCLVAAGLDRMIRMYL